MRLVLIVIQMLLFSVVVCAQAPDGAPVLSRVSVGLPDASGTTAVGGSAGAVPPDADLVLVTLETGHYTTTRAAADGSFNASLFAPAGASIMIKSDPAHRHVPKLASLTLLDGFLGEAITLPGTIARIGSSVSGDGLAFACVGQQRGLPDGVWAAEGTFNKQQYEPGEVIRVAGTFTLFAPTLSGAVDPTVSAGLTLELFSDGAGKPSTAWSMFDSALMTPTGLAIERPPALDTTHGPVAALVVEGNRARAAFTTTFAIPADLRPGYYVPSFQFSVRGVPTAPPDTSVRRITRVSTPRVWGPASGRPAVLRIGSPAPPRLAVLLLMNDFREGHRGVIAVEDRGRYAPANHAVMATETAVIPRVDPRTGEVRRYNLEPFAMSIGVADRGGPPNPPWIAMRFPSGSLTVTIRAPNGNTRTLGPTPFRQWHVVGIGNLQGHSHEGGPSITDPFQLRTLDPAFDVTFAEEGLHVVSVDGSIDDLWGNRWRVGGTYEINVARSLLIDTAIVPMTPFEVSDTAAAAVRLIPPVPADVEVRVRHAPFSKKPFSDTRISGTANRFGFFTPREALRFNEPGEYRIDVSASWRAPDGALWMGARTFGNVVAPRNAALIAHGRRGIDAQQTERQQWYFRSQTGDEIDLGHHVQIPFHHGDVAWLQDSDAATPVITFQDPSGSVWPTFKALPNNDPTALESLAAIGELPLISGNTNGLDVHLDPERADVIGYSYIGVERPLVGVRELIEAENLNPYWRFDDRYSLQSASGRNGDLPNDFKFQFGGIVLRGALFDPPLYAIYGSLFVLVPDDDPDGGSRVFPPFQGNGGGPSGGPLLRLKGREIDLFFHPAGVWPGTILHRGERISFCGYSAPTLPSRIEIVVTSPSGITRTIRGQANRIGYFHDSSQDFDAFESGVWNAKVRITFDGLTSAGQVTAPFPSGDVLGSREGEFRFYVVDSRTEQLAVSPMPRFVRPADGPITFGIEQPPGLSGVQLAWTTTMPGFILEEGIGSALTYTYDAQKLARDFPNLDLHDGDGLAGVDPISISLFLSGTDASSKRRHFARQIVIRGEELMMPDQNPRPKIRSVR